MLQEIDETLRPVRVAYFTRVRNVGDRISPCLLESLLLRRVIRKRDRLILLTISPIF